MCSYKVNQKKAVCGILFSNDKQQVLLIKRRDVPVWVLPGGGVELNESPEQAILREMEEETGYRVEIKRPIAIYLPVNKLTQLTYFYECIATFGCATSGSETIEAKFFPLTHLPKKLMPPPYSHWIDDAKQNLSDLIIKKIEGVSYLVLIKLLLQHPLLVVRFLLAKMGWHINSKDSTS